MRIYEGLAQAVNEVERDLNEMGTLVHPETMQDKNVKDNDDFITKEIQGYSFMITSQKFIWQDIKELGLNRAYIDEEVDARISSTYLNPGEAYLNRLEVWQQFLHDGKFSYTYNERIREQLTPILENLIKNPNTRQAIITLYDKDKDLANIGGKARIPCSMYYQFLRRVRDNVEYLDCIYTMRSCDFYTHFPYDIALTMGFQRALADYLDIEPGRFTQFIGSLHAYRKDWNKKKVF